MKDRIIVGTPVKLSHVLIGIIVVIFLSLFLTGFGYQPWWLFLIVLILGVFVTLPTCFSSYWQIDSKNIKMLLLFIVKICVSVPVILIPTI